MNHISLFSGYEGFGLGLKLAGLDIRTVAYCEYDKYCQEIIRARVRDGLLDDAPIWPDVRTFNGRPFNGRVGLVTGGFPCQPHSVAGQRKGEADERNLWPDTLRLIGEVGPEYVLLENVPGILANGYGGIVVGQLSSIGYDCQWGVVSAADVGANHLRNRWWVLAHAQGQGLEGEDWREQRLTGTPRHGGTWRQDEPKVAQPLRQPGLQTDPTAGSKRSQRDSRDDAGGGCGACQPGTGWWEVEPGLGRVVNGCPHRVERLKALGNGIVPAVVREFLRQLEKK